MSVVRARKEAAKRLALALQTRYRRLIESNGKSEDEIVVATSDMAMGLYENVEFIINVLKDYGGLEARFEPMTRPVLCRHLLTISPKCRQFLLPAATS